MHLQAGMTRAQEIIQELAEVDQQLEDLASEELVLDTRKTVLLAERRRLKKEKRNVKKQSEGRRASARIAGEHIVAVGVMIHTVSDNAAAAPSIRLYKKVVRSSSSQALGTQHLPE